MNRILSTIIIYFSNMNSSQLSHNDDEPSKIGDEEMKNYGGWTYHQKILYVIFLDINKTIMVSKKKRKNFRIFDKMSEFIITRDPLQCRSHHQKILEKFLDIKSILTYFKRLINPEDYKRQYKLCSGKKLRRTKNVKVKQEQLYQVPQIKLQEVKEGPMLKTEVNQAINGSDSSNEHQELQNVKEQNPPSNINENQTAQFGLFKMQAQYLQYYTGDIKPMVTPFGIYYLFQQPQLSLF